MGLFSRNKKKKAEAEAASAEAAAAAAEAARVKAEQQRLATEAAAREAKHQAASQKAAAEREKQDEVLVKITEKRKYLERIEAALTRFEQDHKKAGQQAVAAKQAKNMVEAKSHMRNVIRLKKKMEQYQNMVNTTQTQLDALEDIATHREAQAGNQDFTDYIKEQKLDVNTVEDQLQDMRDALDQVNEVQNAITVDANMNGSAYNDAETLDELEALEKQFAEEAAAEIPNVPGDVPTMPAAPAKAPNPAATLSNDEEEEMRRLEAEIAM